MADSHTEYSFRSGEQENQVFERSGRFYSIKGNWFFKTREDINYGPYISRTECKYAYQEFLDLVSSQSDLSSMPVDFCDVGSDWKVPKINFN